jgi:hypothetical protein
MPTEAEVKQFLDQMDRDMAETREMLASTRYEKAWGVKVKLALDTE